MDTKTKTGGHSVDVYRYGLDALYHFMPEAKLVPFLAVGAGAMTLSGPSSYGNIDGTDPSVNFGAGLRYFLSDDWALRADVRDVVRFDDTWHNLEYTAGISYFFGGEKAKPVVEEAAPVQEEVKAPVQEEVVVVKNSDCDNVPDDLDKCPDTPCGCIVDKDGCPIDSDNDGVCDGLDKCPDTLAGCKVDKDGCPIDSDKDGVCDGLDKCPGTPEGCKVDKDGCPIDSDKDGVIDCLDKCPKTPLGAKVDKDGCPIWISIRMNVQFDFDKAIVKPQYYDDIENLADFMKAHPHLNAILEGHTDNIGTAKYNLCLSQRRADAVMKILVDKFNIAKDRLTAVGYGLTKPIADNKAKEGRQKNRRVQAVLEAMEVKK